MHLNTFLLIIQDQTLDIFFFFNWNHVKAASVPLLFHLHLQQEPDLISTFCFNTAAASALGVSDTEVIGPVEALFTTTDPVARGWAPLLLLLVLIAKVVAVQTPGQVVPQFGEVVVFARLAQGARVGCAVRGHVRAGRTLFTMESCPSGRVLALIGGDGFHRRSAAEDRGGEEEHHRWEEL